MRYPALSSIIAITVCFASFGLFGMSHGGGASSPEVDALRKDVERLRKDVDDLRNEIQRLRDEVDSGRPNHMSGMPDTGALKKIALSAKPTPKQVRDYIQKIIEVSRGQIAYSTDDPQVAKLQLVGHEFLKLLFEMTPNEPSRMYFSEAIKFLIQKEDKDLVLANLSKNVDLVTIVKKYDWVNDAKATLISVLKKHPKYLPDAWIELVAGFKDPETYPDLKWYFMFGYNRSHTFRAIKDLPGINVEENIVKAWKLSQFHPSEGVPMANIAAYYGHKDALQYLVQYLHDGQGFPLDPELAEKARSYFIMYTHQAGTGSELLDWYTTNQNDLVFNAKRRVYLIPDEDMLNDEPTAPLEEEQSERAADASSKNKTHTPPEK